jgi:hypothetical protein
VAGAAHVLALLPAKGVSLAEGEWSGHGLFVSSEKGTIDGGREPEVGLQQFAERLTKVGLAQPRSSLENCERAANFEAKGLSYVPPLGFVDEHGADVGLKGQLDSFSLSGVEPHQFGRRY